MNDMIDANGHPSATMVFESLTKDLDAATGFADPHHVKEVAELIDYLSDHSVLSGIEFYEDKWVIKLEMTTDILVDGQDVDGFRGYVKFTEALTDFVVDWLRTAEPSEEKDAIEEALLVSGVTA